MDGLHTEKRMLLTLQRRATWFALAFIALCVLVVVGATQPVDYWAQTCAQNLASRPLDVTAAVITTLGGAEITGVMTLILSFIWWRHKGIRGLVPLLLFIGVAIEIVLKYSLPHPGPPPDLARGFDYLSLFYLTTPFSFPSGHALRITFLVVLVELRTLLLRVTGWVLVVAVAFTRLYLNIHWASDVVGGILLGLTLATVAATVDARYSSVRRSQEPRITQ